MKYLLLKHYRGPKATPNHFTGEPWSPGDWDAHVQYMSDFTQRLQGSGEYVSSTALTMDGVWVRYDGEGRPPLTDGPFAETKDLVAGWLMIDVDSYERALAVASELSAAPGPGGEPFREWLELRPVMESPPSTIE